MLSVARGVTDADLKTNNPQCINPKVWANNGRRFYATTLDHEEKIRLGAVRAGTNLETIARA